MTDKIKSIQISAKLYPPVHKAVTKLAKRLKVSVNWLINESLAEKVGVNPAEIAEYRRMKND